MAGAAIKENAMKYEIIGDSKKRIDWLAQRQSGIGASEIAGVLGVSPWSSPLSVYADKVLPPEDDSDDEPERFKWGRWMEPLIFRAFGEETGRLVEPAGKLLRSKEWPWLLCTLDAEQVRDDRGGYGLLEVKNTRMYVNEVPEHYWIQIQQQYAVTGYQYGSFAILVQGQEFFWCDVDRDDDWINDVLVPRSREFWELVEKREQPRADAHEATVEALKRLFPREHGEEIPLPPEALDMTEEREQIAREIKKYESAKRSIDSCIRQMMGEAAVGYLTDGRAYTNKANKNGVRVLRAPKEAS